MTNGSDGDGRSGDVSQLSLLELVNSILRGRRLIALCGLSVLVLVVAYLLVQPRKYASSSSFVPQQSMADASLTSTLAAQFGIALAGAAAGESPEFYAYLLRSREILEPLADTTYVVKVGGAPVRESLATLLNIENPRPGERRELVIKALTALLSVSVDRETSIVAVSAVTKWPELSYLLTTRAVDLVNQFNLESRQTQATAQRRFIEQRLEESASALRQAEDDLTQFLQRNRQWSGSAELEFAHDRLQRQVDMRQALYTSLMQAYEQAKIDEVRDTPLINVVEQAEVAVLPVRRRLLLRGAIGLLVGALIGLVIVLGRDVMQMGRRRQSEVFAEFERLREEALLDLVRPWRIFRRRAPQ